MTDTRIRMLLLIVLCGLLGVLAACAKDIPAFASPAVRAAAHAEPVWPDNGILALAYHDIQDSDVDQAFVGVSTDEFIGQLAWLRENGYRPVSVDDILSAERGGTPLPPKAVLLSFDDGYRSFYTRVFPILQAYQWPAVLAPVGTWLDTPAGQPVDFGGKLVERDHFLTWAQVREIAQSGLVEIGAHTNALHYGAIANPQGNTEPAEAIRTFDAHDSRYETRAAYTARIEADTAAISAKIRDVSGRAPRVWAWPYGAVSGTALKIAADDGYSIALTLHDGLGTVNQLMSTPRLLVSNNPSTSEFATAVINVEAAPLMRVAHIDLDYIYDADPAQERRNLDTLVQRIADMQITTVFVQAFADPDGDGLVKSVYFPNHVLPMRADLFNRVSWQLRTRAHVQIYAWMPVLSFDLEPTIARVLRFDPESHTSRPDPDQYQRLSPFDPIARQRIIGLYEDLARAAIFDGVLYHDDAILSDFEDASDPALAAYRAAGLPDSIAALRADRETLQRWTRFKSRYLIDFTNQITDHVRAIRGPQIKTARNIFASPILDPDSEAWFAQNLGDFLANYDWTAPMAMPLMENVPAGHYDAWLDRLVDAVAAHPGALDKTVFELQSRDWRAGHQGPDDGHIDSSLLAHWMQRLQLRGARSFGYYPDDFLRDQPRLKVIRPAISTAWYPFQ